MQLPANTLSRVSILINNDSGFLDAVATLVFRQATAEDGTQVVRTLRCPSLKMLKLQQNIEGLVKLSSLHLCSHSTMVYT